MAVKLITEDRIKRTLDRTDHARLCDKDIQSLKRLLSDLDSSIAKLREYRDTVESRMKHRLLPITEAKSRPEVGPPKLKLGG